MLAISEDPRAPLQVNCVGVPFMGTLDLRYSTSRYQLSTINHQLIKLLPTEPSSNQPAGAAGDTAPPAPAAQPKRSLDPQNGFDW
jgi:hypothetical protein